MTGNGHPSVHVNRLIHEKSPYLLQHAHNPVDWYPWGAEAFERAVRDNKPIFLSIGYSTCHWCHVMAHESFEDPETATLLNREFICIKVDREERPDIDQIYMMVCQVMTGHGGWPLTILMTAERRPFFAATYLPRHTLPGMPGLLEVLPRLVEVWKNQKEDLERYSQDIVEVLKQENREMASRSEPDLPLLNHACQRLEREYDPRNGGFGTAPKFPMPQYLLFLLRIWERTGDAHALSMVEKTLQEMRKGGIYDQVGYGVHRYSVDEGWRIPHFEKTLYDQALLALAELETYQATRDPQYARTAREIFSYVLQDLSAENGGFYSGEDADSEGVEGGFYLWRWEELESILGTSDLQLLSQFYGLRKEGNLSLSLQGAPVDANLLYQERSLSEVVRETGIPADDLASRLEHLRAILQNLRSERARPARDTKILGDWNGLMIAALALGGRVLEDTRFTQAAQDAEKAVIALLQRPDGRMNHVHSGDISYVDAFSADYAALAFAEIELYETTFAPHHLERALDLMHQLTVWYRDTDRGGYYVTPSDGELILVRKKEVYDGAYPSANSLALYNLLRLASLTGSSVYRDQAIQDWESCSGLVETSPLGFMFLLLSVDYLVGPTRQLVITGDGSPRAQEMIRALAGAFLPRLTVHLVTGKEKGGRLPDLAPFLSSYTVSDETRAFVCCGDRCLSPTPDTEQMMEYLNACK